MQEITFAAPKAGPKARPAPGRAEAGEVAPADRRTPERGREDDFGSVVTAGERAAAKKTAADAGKAEVAGAGKAEAVGDPEAGRPFDEDATPPETSAVVAETPVDGTPVVQSPAAIDPEVEPADGDAPVIDASVVDAGTAETGGPDAAEGAQAMTGMQAPPDAGAPAASGGAAPPAMPAARSASPDPPVPGDHAKAPPPGADAKAPPPGADAKAPPPDAETPPPDADAVPGTRTGLEAPSGTAQPAEVRASALVPPQAAPQPALAAGFVLGAVVADGLDWRLTPHVLARTPAHVAAQVQPQAVTGQIVVAIAQSANSRFEVRLDPPELGRVQIQLNPTERGVQVMIMSERPETGDFLRRHAEMLARDLTEAGYGDVTMEFTAGGRDAPRERDRDRAAAPGALASAEAPSAAESAPERPRVVASGTLDIRL